MLDVTNDRPLLHPPGKREYAALGVVLLVFWVVNLLTCSRSPIVWVDEVGYSDPGINLYLGNHFESTAWWTVRADRFWAGNVPLYPFLLSLWLHVFGFSMIAVRSLNYLLVSVAAVTLWRFAASSGAISRGSVRIGLLLLLLCGYGLSYAYRSGRPDMLGLALVAPLPLACLARRNYLTAAVFAVVGCLLPFAGLQLLPLSLVVGILVFLWFGWRVGKFILALWAGACLGTGLLVAMYACLGVLPDFLGSISPHTAGSHAFADKVGNLPGLLFNLEHADPSTEILLVLSLGLLLSGQVRARPVNPAARWLLFGVVTAVLVPLGLYAVGVFMLYYAWMAYVPLAFCLGVYWCEEPWSGKRRAVALALACSAAAIGLPARVTLTAWQWEGRSYAAVEETVGARVGPADEVVCDFPAYYAAKTRASRVYLICYIANMTEEEKKAVSVLIDAPGHIAEAASKLGGTWRDTGTAVGPDQPRRLPRFVLSGSPGVYSLRIWVRAKTSDSGRPSGDA
jgi:hypothetical protein